MCPLCKVLINQETVVAAERMNRLRDTMFEMEDLEGLEAGDLDSGETNDMLYEMAVREVEFIEASRAAMYRFAECERVPDRWKELLMRL